MGRREGEEIGIGEFNVYVFVLKDINPSSI